VTWSAVLGLALALALVLALFGLALGAARRFAHPGQGGQLRIAVLQRTALGPRQGLAAVRVANRVLLVSVGEGGVHLVTELSPAEAAALTEDTTGENAAPGALNVTRWAARSARALRLFGLALLLTLVSARAGLALSMPQTAAAPQNPPPANRAAVAQTSPQASAVVSAAAAALAQQAGGTAPRVSLQMGNGQDSDLRISGTVGSVLFIGLLALLPTLLLLTTSFTRVLVVLHFLKQALGTQSAPPAHLLTALALLITGLIMAPTLADVNTVALQPWMSGQIDEGQMLKAGIEPFRAFMLRQTPEDDLVRYIELTGQAIPETPEQVKLPVLMTAFATSELRAAFQMGFALFLPFVVIDIVVSAVLTSMGMFMLPPAMIALPCKLLLFVLVDGWALMVGSLVTSFA
jgi:flagellar biosynthetic protein FliP